MSPSPVDELALLDLERSNKGASKQRRDQINSEIAVMRDLLPLPESARQRLSQLQIMSLSCVFIRKCNVLQKLFSSQPNQAEVPCEFSQSLTGFLLVTTRDGKLVYISENVTEYLGHSMVDMKTQGDSLFDIVDKRDHGTVQAQLMHGGSDVEQRQPTSFFCRMNMSRTLKRQAGFGDVKVMHVKGHFVTVPGQDPGTEQQVFLAVCSPLITPDVKETLIQNNTMIFKSVHKLDMSFLELTQNGEFHLGITGEEVSGKSWYSSLHPEDVVEAREKHIQLIKSRHEMGCMMTVRMITATNEIIWVNIVMHVRQALLSNSDDPVILCINQVISEQEAYQFKIQGQLFALYANRAPDFFFGSAFCAPIPQSVDSTIGSHNQSPSPNFVNSPFFNGSQSIAEPTYTSSAGSQSFTQNQLFSSQVNMCMRNGIQPQVSGRQGHSNTLKALKRKIQENFTSTCKPTKVPRMFYDGQDNNGYIVSGSTPLPSSFETNSYRNSISINSFPSQHTVTNGPMQLMYGQSNTIISPKHKIIASEPLPKFVQSPSVVQKAPSLEQVVPDLTVPTGYLTPDPSPVSSPEPVTKPEVVQVTDAKPIDPILVAKHLCALKQKQLADRGVETVPRDNGTAKKQLPSLDVSFVDSFFDEIGSLTQEFMALQKMKEITNLVKQEPVDLPLKKTCSQRSSTPVQAQEVKVDDLDIERLLGIGDCDIRGVNGCDSFIDLKVDLDEQRLSLSDPQPSPTPSTPIIDDKMAYDDVISSFALTPESDLDTDQCEDVLDPDSWVLESVNMDIGMQTMYVNPKQVVADHRMKPAGPASVEDGLYQLKQLISSWTPSGVSTSSEESQ